MGTKELIVVGGPNGAGKTTFAEDYVASFGVQYIGADAIAAELSPGNPAQAQIAASREFIRRVEEAIGGEGRFVIESTLSGRTFARLLDRAKKAGFEIAILYLFIDSVETCLDRVQSRVQRGGHNVPEVDVRRRYLRSVLNFWHFGTSIVRWRTIGCYRIIQVPTPRSSQLERRLKKPFSIRNYFPDFNNCSNDCV